MEAMFAESGKEQGLSGDNEGIWRSVAKTSDLEGLDAIQVVVDGKKIAIYRIADLFYATSGICTHAEAELVDGYVDGDVIECPLHAGRFHIPTGKALSAPATHDLETYPVRVIGGDILIDFFLRERISCSVALASHSGDSLVSTSSRKC